MILSTYGVVRQDIEALQKFPFHYVVLDEAQMVKNPSSKTSRAIRKLKARHRLALTGTPVENTIMDIWSQMAFLNPGLLGGERFFKRFYTQPIEKKGDEKRKEKLRKIIYPFVLRRRKSQVEKDLPPKVERLHYCGMLPAQQKLYEETRNQYRNWLLEVLKDPKWQKNKLNILTGIQKLRQIAIHPKLVQHDDYELDQSGKYREVMRMIHRVIGKDSKVLVFSQFVKVLKLFRGELDEQKIPYCYLDGSTRHRQVEVDRFQNDKDIQVFLISLKAGGVGLNLTAADYVFILDPWWNPAVENQAVDRSHRIGQEKTVFFFKFITEGSIEEKIVALQKRKSQLSDDLINVDEDLYQHMGADELKALFANV